MLDLGIPVVAQPVSRVWRNWEAEEFKRMRFNLFWEAQSRGFKLFLVFTIPVLTGVFGSKLGLASALGINIAWSLFLTLIYERRVGDREDDTLATPKGEAKKSPLIWLWCGLKMVIFAGVKDLVVTRFLGVMRWMVLKLPPPARKAHFAFVIVALILVGIRASHQYLYETGFVGKTLVGWNWFWSMLWGWAMVLISILWII
jgi:hypothetical protein